MDINRVCGATPSEMAYETGFVRFANGEITKKEWEKICTNYTIELMREKADVLERLKKN